MLYSGTLFANMLGEKVGGRMLRILLAEDDRNFGHILKKELEEAECTVDLVTNGVDAVLNFMKNPYGFVLLDIRMPRLCGNDALRIIRGFNPRVPAITFSGNAGSAEVTESEELGAIKCLRKPFEIGGLKEEIRKYAGKQIEIQGLVSGSFGVDLTGQKR